MSPRSFRPVHNGHPRPQRSRAITAAAGLFLASILPAHALIKFNDGRDELFIIGAAGLAYDSNLFADKAGTGDTILLSTLDLEYRRKAGAIGVNGNLGLNSAAFDKYSEENYSDPHANLELTKTGGRTTGKLSANAARSSRADSLLNLRTTSWDYGARLQCKYPVIKRYTLGADIGYEGHDYRSGLGLFDVDSYSAGADLLYRYTSERDILAGYRLRITDTTANTQSRDHAFTVGTTGKLGAKLDGTVRLGYQLRETDRAAFGRNDTYSALTTIVATTWTVTRRFNIVAQGSKDFSTVATDSNADTTRGSLDAMFAATKKLKFTGSAGTGRVRFLARGHAQRRDTFLDVGAGAAYAANEHLSLSLTAAHYTNWSTLALADYKRLTISLIVSSRW